MANNKKGRLPEPDERAYANVLKDGTWIRTPEEEGGQAKRAELELQQAVLDALRQVPDGSLHHLRVNGTVYWSNVAATELALRAAKEGK